jgi:putative SbcD/Mre11-related phosphoesterase
MKILENIKIVDLGLIYEDNLIIGDLQLGYEEHLQRKGILLPKFQLKSILEKLEKIFNKVKVKRVIINGDIKHEFGSILNQEWTDSLKLFDFLSKKVEEIILIRGNHDVMLGPIAKKRNIKIIDSWEDDKVTIIHGHKIPEKLNEIVIIGHEHPAISFEEKPSEKFKCFLVGKYKKSKLIVTPSFHDLTEGSDITKGKHLSPFLKKGVKNFNCYIVSEDKVRFFGKVKNLN